MRKLLSILTALMLPILASGQNAGAVYINGALYGGSGGAETDPIFGASAAAGLTLADISNWDTAYGWGDHATNGYLTSESDPIWSAASNLYATLNFVTNLPISTFSNDAGYLTSFTETDPIWAGVSNIVTQNALLGATAYGWGDHSTNGYLTSYTETDPIWSAASNLYATLDYVDNATNDNYSALTVAFTTADTTLSNNLSAAYIAADTTLSNNLTTAFAAADTVVSNWAFNELTNRYTKAEADIATTNVMATVPVFGATGLWTHAFLSVTNIADSVNEVVNWQLLTNHSAWLSGIVGSNQIAAATVTTNEMEQGTIDYLRGAGDPGELRFVWDDIDGLTDAFADYIAGFRMPDGNDSRVTVLLERPSDLDTNNTIYLHVAVWPNEDTLTGTGIVYRLDVRFADNGETLNAATPDFTATITNNMASPTQYDLTKLVLGGAGANWQKEYAILEFWILGNDPASTFDRRLGLQHAATIHYTKKGP